MRGEDVPPSSTHVSQGDQALLHATFVPTLRNEGEYFRRNPIDRCEAVLDGPNQAKYFCCVPFEAVDLESEHYKTQCKTRKFNASGIRALFLSLSPQIGPWSFRSCKVLVSAQNVNEGG